MINSETLKDMIGYFSQLNIEDKEKLINSFNPIYNDEKKRLREIELQKELDRLEPIILNKLQIGSVFSKSNDALVYFLIENISREKDCIEVCYKKFIVGNEFNTSTSVIKYLNSIMQFNEWLSILEVNSKENMDNAIAKWYGV